MRRTTPFGGSRKRTRAVLSGFAAMAIVAAVFAACAQAAPPVNDSFLSAAELGPNLPVSVEGTTADSTVEPGEPEPVAELAGSVWFRWTAPAGFDRTLRLRVCRTTVPLSGFFGINTLYSGGENLAGLEPHTISYGACRELLYLAEPETTYYLQVGNEVGYPFERDRFTVEAGVVDGPPNDRIADATEIVGPLPRKLNGTNRYASVDTIGEFDFFDFGHTVWYRINVVATGTLRLDACSDKILPSAHVFDPASPDFARFEPVDHEHIAFDVGECLLLPSDHTEQVVEAGKEYLIGIDTWDIPLISSHGPFTLRLSGTARLAPGLPNTIRIRKVRARPKHRKVDIKVQVPGPGTVEVLASRKVRGERREVKRARVVNLEAVARGSFRDTLRRKGRRRAVVRIRFTPDGPGGRPNTISRNIMFRHKQAGREPAAREKVSG